MIYQNESHVRLEESTHIKKWRGIDPNSSDAFEKLENSESDCSDNE